jgi:hypothetical protein
LEIELKDLADVIGKAENWLLDVANDVDGVWDQEALVYLRSRGRAPSNNRDQQLPPFTKR